MSPKKKSRTVIADIEDASDRSSSGALNVPQEDPTSDLGTYLIPQGWTHDGTLNAPIRRSNRIRYQTDRYVSGVSPLMIHCIFL